MALTQLRHLIMGHIRDMMGIAPSLLLQNGITVRRVEGQEIASIAEVQV